MSILPEMEILVNDEQLANAEGSLCLNADGDSSESDESDLQSAKHPEQRILRQFGIRIYFGDKQQQNASEERNRTNDELFATFSACNSCFTSASHTHGDCASRTDGKVAIIAQ